ncbi:helix-turn-helix domain-containing protein [Actibacterium sp. D379-3]
MTPETPDDADWYSEQTATFGDRMVGAREALGWSQAELAKRLGVKLKTVRAWEEDLNEPRANKLQMLAGVLNVSIMWLLTGEGDGLDAPGGALPLAADVSAMLAEIRQVKTEMGQMADRLGVLEKRLRATLKEGA